jgi:hypothetical protein
MIRYDGDVELDGHGNMEIWRYGDMEIWRFPFIPLFLVGFDSMIW